MQDNTQQPQPTFKRIDKYLYQLTNPIGSGYSSVVYKGKNEQTSNTVAVKVINMKQIHGIHHQLLANEIDALRKVNHPNCLQLYDVFHSANNTYIITEYCNQGDLATLISKKQITEKEATHLLQDIVKGYSEIYKKGLIHRDLKPANILLSNGVAKIADFGFAQKINNSSQSNFNIGTPLYMSPETLIYSVYNTKCDIWAIGALYFEILVGCPPFKAMEERELLDRILHQPIYFPKHLKISEQSKDLISRCLCTDPNYRISMEEIQNHVLIKGETKAENLDNKYLSRALLVNSQDGQKLKFDIERNSQEIFYQSVQMLNKENQDQPISKREKSVDKQLINAFKPLNIHPTEEQLTFQSRQIGSNRLVSKGAGEQKIKMANQQSEKPQMIRAESKKHTQLKS